jgi:hypothetical protein
MPGGRKLLLRDEEAERALIGRFGLEELFARYRLRNTTAVDAGVTLLGKIIAATIHPGMSMLAQRPNPIVQNRTSTGPLRCPMMLGRVLAQAFAARERTCQIGSSRLNDQR